MGWDVWSLRIRASACTHRIGKAVAAHLSLPDALRERTSAEALGLQAGVHAQVVQIPVGAERSLQRFPLLPFS